MADLPLCINKGEAAQRELELPQRIIAIGHVYITRFHNQMAIASVDKFADWSSATRSLRPTTRGWGGILPQSAGALATANGSHRDSVLADDSMATFGGKSGRPA